MTRARGYFVAGTDTGVGKTLVSAALVRAFADGGRRVVGLKPVASGSDPTPAGLRNADALALMAEASVELPYDVVNPYVFEPAIAPHLAAAEKNLSIDAQNITRIVDNVREQVDIVVVEGVGGWHVPLNRQQDTADLAVMLGLPVILVVGMRLGCLNHAVLTANAIAAVGLPLVGWIANSIDPQFERFAQNLDELQTRIAAPLLGTIPFSDVPPCVIQATNQLSLDPLQ
ncbi:MAG: dethiobiotin synthase [Gammaproteobacteria bacterium]|nr:dethiobiotin synthase [Gammaproteobacteria bacterium]